MTAKEKSAAIHLALIKEIIAEIQAENKTKINL